MERRATKPPIGARQAHADSTSSEGGKEGKGGSSSRRGATSTMTMGVRLTRQQVRASRNSFSLYISLLSLSSSNARVPYVHPERAHGVYSYVLKFDPPILPSYVHSIPTPQKK